ncbi:hypothetical protein A0I64_19680 [Salmonella enterica subsp. enterica serovar London]|nr:hypothetical protein [Salmonella enterica]EAB6746674.1 hypothetical protein [Salmonella enterica subsp. enterica serovar London]EAC1408934.1 hypothetical protein [Salmonella enterica subsp. enterica]EAN5440460.1 hypothetical protein [Salmonella enterica]EAO0566667.1 hypothetical protein [Salmonella enterica]
MNERSQRGGSLKDEVHTRSIIVLSKEEPMEMVAYFTIIPTVLLLSGCNTMMLKDHVNDVQRREVVWKTDKIIGFTKDKKSNSWMLAGEKENYLFPRAHPERTKDNYRDSLANAMENQEFDKKYLTLSYDRNTNECFYAYKLACSISMDYDITTFNSEKLAQIQSIIPGDHSFKRENRSYYSFIFTEEDVQGSILKKIRDDRVERINKPFTLIIKKQDTAYSQAFYPFTIIADIVTAPLQLIALPILWSSLKLPAQG